MGKPYLPSLLRVLHGATALLVLGAWISGVLVYNQGDGRWGRLPQLLQADVEWIDLHGTVGVVLLPVAVLLGLYALSPGWAMLKRASNAVALLALVLAIGSGKAMDEDWLRSGSLNHLAYNLHLLAWGVLSLAVVLHLAGAWRRGGGAWLMAMWSLAVRSGDGPDRWVSQIRQSISRRQDQRSRRNG
jgi:hypothetical protein